MIIWTVASETPKLLELKFYFVSVVVVFNLKEF